jgi:hypothetical protein
VYLNYRSPLTPKIAAAREFRKSWFHNGVVEEWGNLL